MALAEIDTPLSDQRPLGYDKHVEGLLDLEAEEVSLEEEDVSDDESQDFSRTGASSSSSHTLGSSSEISLE